MSLWTPLVHYYRSCITREQDLHVRVPADPSASVVLRDIDEHLITHRATTTIITDPNHTRPILAYLNRRGRGIGGSFIYGYPLARHAGALIPLAFTEVTLEPGSAPQTVLLTRGNAELRANRHFLRYEAGLTDAEVDGLLMALRSPRFKAPAGVLDQYLLEVDVVYDAVLFASDAAPASRGPSRELQLMEQLKRDRLPDAIRIFIGELGIPTTAPAEDGLTIVQADPVQSEVLRRRRSSFLTVVGPDGSGKTQTALNLIANAVADRKKVLYISPDPEALEAVHRGLVGSFPGVLRIGGLEAWSASLAHARQVMQAVKESNPPAESAASDLTESRRLEQMIAKMEADEEALFRLHGLNAELDRLARAMGRQYEADPNRNWVDSLSARMAPETAAQFAPAQLVGIRRLLARTSIWETGDGSITGRMRDKMRAGQIKTTLRQLGVPEFCHPDGDLQEQLTWLAQLEQAYPLLLVRARLLHVQTERGRFAPLGSLQADLAANWPTKMALDRRRLADAWAAQAERVRPTADQLLEVIAEEEKALSPTGATTKRAALRRERFAALTDSFPAVLSPTLTVAGILPNEPEFFDLLIVDDASRVDIPSFLPVLYRAKRVCLLGDLKGPRHSTWLGEEEDSRLLGQVEGHNLAAFAYVDQSVLDRAVQVVGKDALLRLNRQYVLPATISDWCEAQAENSTVRAIRQGPNALLFEDVPEGQTIYPTPEAISQAQNPLEAKRVIRLVTQSIAEGQTSLAVFTPFRGQALLLQTLLTRLSQVEPDPGRAAALGQVPVATLGSALPHRCHTVLLSLVAARGSTPETLFWLDRQGESLVQMVSRATDRVIVAGDRESLEAGGPTLVGLVDYADRLRSEEEPSAPAPSGLQPARLGLLQGDHAALVDWLTIPGNPSELFSDVERELYTRLAELLRGRPVHLAPRLSLAWSLEPPVLYALSATERRSLLESRPLLTLVHSRSLHPIAVVELDLPADEQDRLCDALCRQIKLPLVRIRPGEWDLLRSITALIQNEGGHGPR